MMNPIYELPTLNFVGGSTKPLFFRFFRKTKDEPFDLTRCEARLAIVNYDSGSSKPLLTKSMTLDSETASDGSKNVFSVTLSPADTLNLRGRYTYMITIKDMNDSGKVDIPGKGVMYISNNIDKDYAIS